MEEVLRVEGLHKSFGDLEVLRGIDLVVHKGETIVILGSSGSGKSTLLRCINFLELPTAGRIHLNGKPLGQTRRKRDGRETIHYAERDLCKVRAQVGMVFQQFNLFPHRTAIRNVMEGLLSVLKIPKQEAELRAQEYLAKVGLVEKANEYPSRLSGG